MDNKKVSIKPKVKTKLKVKKKIAVGNVKANNKKIKLKQKQKQNQKQVNTQKVTINLSDLKPKRTYTRRKPAVPKQAMVTPTQPQTFQPNNQVLVNDLTQKLKEHEKILQKKIDNELKQNEIKEQKKINKMVHESIPDLKDSDIDAMMQQHQNMLKANEKNSGINKDADNFFSRMNDDDVPFQFPRRSSSLSAAIAVPESDYMKQQKDESNREIAKLKANIVGKEASDVAKERIRQQKAKATRERHALEKEKNIEREINRLKQSSLSDLKKKYSSTASIKTATEPKQVISRIIQQKYNIPFKNAKSYTSQHF